MPHFVHADGYVTPLPEGHRFPMAKFNLLRDVLVAEGVATHFHTPEPVSVARLELAHTPAYVADVLACRLDPQHVRRIGLPLSPALVHRTRLEVGGTVRTVELALAHGLACNLAGGTHHAFAGAGSGFCVFNDLAVAARVATRELGVGRVLVIDLDVHQGDGTAAIFAGDDAVFTFSVHCEANFPLHKQRSDLDVGLPPGVGDAAYLALLAEHVPRLLARVEPDLVFYDAGVDVHERDRLGKLKLTDAGLLARDRYVLSQCLAHEVPTACVIGGGYSDEVPALASRHATLHRAAVAVAGEAGRTR